MQPQSIAQLLPRIAAGRYDKRHPLFRQGRLSRGAVSLPPGVNSHRADADLGADLGAADQLCGGTAVGS